MSELHLVSVTPGLSSVTPSSGSDEPPDAEIKIERFATSIWADSFELFGMAAEPENAHLFNACVMDDIETTILRLKAVQAMIGHSRAA